MGQEKMRLETKSSLESLESPDKTCLVRSVRALLWILLMLACLSTLNHQISEQAPNASS